MSEREILFRGKRKDSGEWIYGVPITDKATNNVYIITSTAGASLKSEINNMCATGFRIICNTIGQYTGLIDKNGTRIFEGDIIKISNAYDECDYSISEVYGFNGVLCVDCPTADYDFNALGFLDDDNEFIFEVIGNIHDNPELLKGE